MRYTKPVAAAEGCDLVRSASKTCCHPILKTTRAPLTGGRTQVLLWGWRGRTPRQPRWAMDGPSRRAPITVPQRGHRGSLGDPGRMVGQGLFGSFWVLPKGTRCKSETNISVKRECRICIRWFCCSCLYSLHIHSMCHGYLRVPPLRRLTFVKQPQK